MLHRRVTFVFPEPLVLHHRLELVLERVQSRTVVHIDVPMPVRYGATKVSEQRLSFIYGLDFAPIEVGRNHSGGHYGGLGISNR